jgi:uncharacterized membrane protein YoaK (UPF0700 family)
MELTFWWPIVPFVAFAFAWAWVQSRRFTLAWRVALSLSFASIAFAIGEAAAFHVGAPAYDWFIAAIFVGMLAGVLGLVAMKLSEP